MKQLIILFCSLAVLLEPALFAELPKEYLNAPNSIEDATASIPVINYQNSLVFKSSSYNSTRFKRAAPVRTPAGYRSQLFPSPLNYGLRQHKQTLPKLGTTTNGNGNRRNSFGGFPPIQPSSKPLFGMDSTSSSRRSSLDSLTNRMSQLDLNSPSRPLADVDGWQRQRINNFKTDNNCYFCTAAGLSGKTTYSLAKESGVMPKTTGGTIDDTLQLIKPYHPNAQSRTFDSISTANKYMDSRVRPGSSEPFGFAYHHSTTPRPLFFNPNNANNGPDGHMIVMNARKTPDGSLQRTNVDFQLSPSKRQTRDSLNFSPTGPVHVIDINPPKPMDTWNPFKRNRHQFELDPSIVEPIGKRHRAPGFGQ